jgi:hypothetical protein
MTRTIRLSRPIIAVVIGVPLLAAGLILGRIPYPVAGGFRQSAYWTDHMCRLAHQIQSSAGMTPMCTQAHAVLDVCGALIVAGIASVSVGIALVVTGRRARTAAERLAAMQRHPSSHRRAGVSR